VKARLLNYLITLLIVGLAIWAAAFVYDRYIQTPWTRDGQVRANIVGIAPRVSGPIIHVAVRDNQQLQKGDLLFEIDPADFQAQVDIAAGQVQNGEANLKQEEQNLQRQTELYRTHVNTAQDFQNAQDTFAAAQAQLASAKANLQLARLNVSYTKVFAPVSGYVTNMNTSEGTYVTAGKQLMAVVDTGSFWIAGYFKETQLPHIQVGQKALITMMGYENRPFQGVVRSFGWGIYVQDGSGGDSTDLLPSVNQTIDWVRLPQRFPVRLHVLGASPVALRIGQTVSVAMRPEVELGGAPTRTLSLNRDHGFPECFDRTEVALDGPGPLCRLKSALRDQAWAGGFARLVLHSGLAIAA
jgi:multidrug resistance efflux pump